MNILISIDGIGHDVFKSNTNLIDNFRDYSWIKQLNTTLPSNTYAAHMSAVTGESNFKHGIVDNVIVEDSSYNIESFYITDKKKYERHVKKNTIFHLIEEEDLKTKAINWPMCKGFPNYIVTNGDLTKNQENVSLDERIDEETFKLGIEEIKKNQLNLLALYFWGFDAKCHKYGKDSKESQDSVKKIFGYINEIIKKTESDPKSNVVIFSDHGLVNRTKSFYPKKYLIENKYLKKDEESKIEFLADGSGAALLYSKLEKNRIKSLIKNLEDTGYISKVHEIELDDKSIIYPNAIIDFKKGICVEGITDNELPKYEEMRAIHGHSSSLVDEINGFLIAKGDLFKKGMIVNDAEIIDIAPTICWLNKISVNCTGKILEELLS